jgi:hypothetical protein
MTTTIKKSTLKKLVKEEMKKVLEERKPGNYDDEDTSSTKLPSSVTMILDKISPYLSKTNFSMLQVAGIFTKIINALEKTDRTKIKMAIKRVYTNPAL